MCDSTKYPCPSQIELLQIPREKSSQKPKFLMESTVYKQNWNFEFQKDNQPLWKGYGDLLEYVLNHSVKELILVLTMFLVRFHGIPYMRIKVIKSYYAVTISFLCL